MCSERTLNYNKQYTFFFFSYREKDKCNTILNTIPSNPFF